MPRAVVVLVGLAGAKYTRQTCHVIKMNGVFALGARKSQVDTTAPVSTHANRAPEKKAKVTENSGKYKGKKIRFLEIERCAAAAEIHSLKEYRVRIPSSPTAVPM
ncbi:hypothetical protein Trydic_g17091 [Trypoxylus dichotomus]